MFVTSQGSAYARFRRALETGNELLVIATARELARVPLEDALRICLLIRGGDLDRYERAAVRWLGRFALEARSVTIMPCGLLPMRFVNRNRKVRQFRESKSAPARRLKSRPLEGCGGFSPGEP